ncbi:hypothetical protein LXL04_023268 [Taraxacum kok-saghyz]
MKAMSMEWMIGIEHRPIPGTQFSARNRSRHSQMVSVLGLWGQRADVLFVTIDLPNTKNVKLKLEPEGKFYFSATVGSENLPYEIDINFHDKVKVNESKASVGPRTIVYLIKKEESKWWNRLLKEEERLQCL